MNKQITQKEFQNQIRLVKSVAVTGFRWSGTPQLLLRLIRKEFEEWLDPKVEDHDIFSLEFIGEGSKYD